MSIRLIEFTDQKIVYKTIDESIYLPSKNILSWVSFEDEMEKGCLWLKEQLNLDSFCIDALCHEQTRPRIFISPSQEIVLLLRIPSFNQNDCLESLSIRILIKENALITLSRTKLPVIQAVMEKIKSDFHEVNSPFYLVWLICKHSNEAITDYILNLDEELILVEENWEEKHTLDTLQIRTIKLNLSHLRRFLHPQLETYQKLSVSMDEQLKEKKKERQTYHSRWRENINFLKRDIEALTEMQERVNILHETFQQEMHESTNRIMYLLSIVATFFLPLTFIASLLGMNLSGIPGSQSPWAFLLACSLIMFIAVIQWALFRRWKWLK